MVGTIFHLKPLQPLHNISMKTPWSSPSPTSIKLKAPIHSQVFQHFCQLLKTLAKAKSMFMQLLNKNKQQNSGNNKNSYLFTINMKKKKKKTMFMNSFRMHYNWCSSSHVLPMPEFSAGGHDYYDSTWNSVVPAEEFQHGLDSQLSGYLQWLEEKGVENTTTTITTTAAAADVETGELEINKLAEKFIESCHEKFRLEKQESYRRYQEMLARGM